MKGLIAGLAVLVVAGLAFFLYSTPAAPPPEMTEAEIAQIEAEVTEWAEGFMATWGGGAPEDDCRAMAAFSHPDHVTHLGGGEPRRRVDTFDSCMTTRARWEGGYTGSWTETNIRVLSPDAAVFLGRMSGNWKHTDGSIHHYPAGAQLILIERTADGWGITLNQNSNGPSEVVEEG